MSTLPFPRSELTIENYRENGIFFLTGVLTENDVKALNRRGYSIVANARALGTSKPASWASNR